MQCRARRGLLADERAVVQRREHHVRVQLRERERGALVVQRLRERGEHHHVDDGDARGDGAGLDGQPGELVDERVGAAEASLRLQELSRHRLSVSEQIKTS